MSEVLLDGYGIKLKAIRGIPDNSCPRKGKRGYREIIIETNKGDAYVVGCSACHVLGYGFQTLSTSAKRDEVWAE